MIILALILFVLLMCGITPGMIAMGIIAVIALPSQYIIYFILRKAHPEKDDIDIWYDKRGNNILIMNSETIIWALLALFVVKITSCAEYRNVASLLGCRYALMHHFIFRISILAIKKV